jgi:hypothetical protein
MGADMRMLNEFLFDRMDAPLLDGSGITPDPELVARNQERAKKVIESMGRLWCCHPEHDKEIIG